MKVFTRLLFLVLMQLAFLMGFAQSTTSQPPATAGCPNAIKFEGFENGSFTANGETALSLGLPRNGSYETVQNAGQGGGGGYLNVAPHSGSFLMLIHTSASAIANLYATTINVVAGQTYNFCAYIANAKTDPVSGFTLTLTAGSKVIATGTAVYKWAQLCGSYTATASGPVTFAVKDPNPTYGPSHFLALDDLCITTTGTPTPSADATIGDFVWNDKNQNGIQDAGEPGLSKVSVTITGIGGFTKTTTTDANGFYQFTGLAAGTYSINFSSPAGFGPSPANQGSNDEKDSDPVNGTVSVTLTAGQTNNSIDAGFCTVPNLSTATVGNFVWNDINQNGIQDATEPGLSKVSVTITGTGGFTKTTTTDANGFYQFTGLAAGTYSINFIAPVGFGPSPANQGSNDEKDSDPVNGTVSVTLSPGETNNSVDAGFCKVTTAANLTLGNQVWNDYDGDGKHDPDEPGIPGAIISLYTDNNGDNKPDGAAITTATSDATGNYLFTGLTAGRYIVSMPILPGYQKSPNSTTQDTSPFPDNNVDDDNNLVFLDGPNTVGGTLYTNAITLSAGDEPTTDGDGANGNLTFDLAQCGNLFIGDYVWNDANGNGIQDAGEYGINGATVTITFSDGRTATTTTHYYNPDNNSEIEKYNGYYDFKNLGLGTYKITFSTPAGLTPSPANQGTDDAKDSDPVNGAPVTVILDNPLKSNLTVDAGFYDKTKIPTGHIGDFVWKDLNKNGIQDAGEPGLQGVTVKLTSATGTTVSTTTDKGGLYQFDNLAAGSYTLTFTTPSGYAASPANVGTDDAKDSDADNGTVTVTLAANEVNNSVDAGYTLPVPQAGNCEDFNRGFGAGGSDLYPGLPRNGSYQVVKSVSELGGGGYLDIKSPTGSYFLAAHTSNDVNDRVWYTTINVTPGKTYKFCTSVTLLKNLGSGADYILGLYVNGTSIGSGRVTFDWTSICGTYTVPAGVTSIELSVRDPKKGLFFVAIDDVCASEAPPTVDCAGTNGTGGYYGGFEAGSGNFGSNAGSDLYNGLPRNGSYEVVKSVDELGGGGYLNIHPKSGSYFLAAHTSNDENDRVWYTKVSVIPGQTYNFCAAVTLLKNLGDGANYILGIYANGTQIGTGRVTFDWTQICGSYTVPAGVTSLELSIKDPKKGLFFVAIDDICITHTNSLTIGNYVWNDWNGNGTKDADEYGIPNIDVKLYRVNTGATINNDRNSAPDFGTLAATTKTNGQGYYTFTGLAEGKYYTSITVLPGYSKSPNYIKKDDPNSFLTSTSDPDNDIDDDNNAIRPATAKTGDEIYTNVITLTAGTEPTYDGDDNNGNLTLDMALCGNLWIGNFVWNDRNGDGIQNNNEAGIDGVDITVLLPDGVTKISAKTYTWNDTANHNISKSGYYDIPRAGPGTYVLTFNNPDAGYKLTLPNQGTNDALDSDPINGTVTVVLDENSSNFTIDAGFTPSQAAQRVADTTAVSKASSGDCNLKLALETKNPLCFNNLTGSVIATVTGNVGKVSYNWSNGSTGTNLMNIGEGKYTLTVKDRETGCEVTSDQAVITYPAKMEATVKSAEKNGYNIACKDSKTGIIDLEVKGGKGIYTYQWSNGATTQDLGDVAAGSYSVTVKDAGGCPVKAEITLKEPATKLEVSSNVSQPGCDDKTGSVELRVSGGVAPYTFNWSNGTTTSSIKKVAPGVYTVVVKDAVGCEVSNQFEIKEYNLTVSAKASNETLNRTNGEEATTLHAVAAGGTGELTYTWETAESMSETDKANTTVSPKNSTEYKVTVKDAAGCSASATVAVKVVTEAAKPASTIEMAGERVRVTPNPSNGNFNVLLNGFTGKVDMKVLDASGKAVATKPVEVSSRQTVVPFSLTTLPNGLYFVNVISAEGSFKEKMIIRHN